MITLTSAISSLYPNASFSLENEDYETLNWMTDGVEKPSLPDLQAEQSRLQVIYDASEYQRRRVKEYPSIGDQLDALFHAGVFPPEMAAQIQAIKDKYPKGNQ